jgi:hypothetical protein
VLCSSSTKIIGNKAFQFCITLNYIDGTIATIGQQAFESCGNLRQFNFDETVFIDSSAFTGSGLEEVSLQVLSHISQNTFANCFNLKKVNLGIVKEIGKNAFLNTALTRLVIPETVTSIGEQAFANNTYLTNLIFFGQNPPEIKNNSFANCSVHNVWIMDDTSLNAYTKKLPAFLSKHIKPINNPADLFPLFSF